MRVKIIHILWVAAISILSAGSANAQRYPERKDIRAGNREYEQANYPQCEVSYLRALAKNPSSYEATFNLGNSLYRQERYDESAQIFQNLAQDTTRADHIAQCHYNAGNALFQQRKLQESLEEYKNSLRKNPSDMDAKFNLAYVKKLLENEQNNGGGGDNNQDQDQNQDKQDQNQDQNQQDQNQDKQDQKQDKQDQGDQDKNKDKGKHDDKPQQGEQPQQQQGMTQAEAQQMLDAIQAQEDRTQDKVDEKKKAAVVVRSARNW